MFLNPKPMDSVAHSQIIQKFINELHKSILVDVSKTSDIVHTAYIDSIKEKLWVGMNGIRIKNGLQPYKLTQMQIYPILDKKSQIIYLLTMTFTNNNLCNDNGFNTMFDELGIQIESAINN
jgi:predicted transcriptional regulator